MKRALKFFMLLIGLTVIYASRPNVSTKNAQSLFIIIYTPGTGWDKSKQPAEQAFFKTHSQRMQSLRKENKILLGARYSDKGMIVMPGESEEEIRKIIFSDSAVLMNTFSVEVYPYNVFYYGCLEKPQ